MFLPVVLFIFILTHYVSSRYVTHENAYLVGRFTISICLSNWVVLTRCTRKRNIVTGLRFIRGTRDRQLVFSGKHGFNRCSPQTQLLHAYRPSEGKRPNARHCREVSHRKKAPPARALTSRATAISSDRKWHFATVSTHVSSIVTRRNRRIVSSFLLLMKVILAQHITLTVSVFLRSCSRLSIHAFLLPNIFYWSRAFGWTRGNCVRTAHFTENT